MVSVPIFFHIFMFHHIPLLCEEAERSFRLLIFEYRLRRKGVILWVDKIYDEFIPNEEDTK